MKLVRYGSRGSERPGLIDDQGCIRDLSADIPDIDSLAIAGGALERLRHLQADELPIVGPAHQIRLGPPVTGIGKIVCAGMNYADHCAEAGLPIPSEPALFMKPPSAVCGPYDEIILPEHAEKADWEVELAVVIGKHAKNVSEKEALGHVAGYLILNDISERGWQMERGGQWMKGKGADTFAPLGPWLVTRDEIPDPQNLKLWLDLNGERQQQGNTSQMVFGVAYLISYISRFMSLQPGDIVSTGTPPGVGMGQKPQRWLAPGDRIQAGIEGLGEQKQIVVQSEMLVSAA